MLCLDAGTLDPKPLKSVSTQLSTSHSTFVLARMKAESTVAVT